MFKDYCSAVPKIYDLKPDLRTNKVYSSVWFNTYSLPCFNKYYELFYLNKRIPLNIGELLTAKGLAYWSLDDGFIQGNNFRFCTDSFTLNEVELLIKVLKDNFDLNCSSQIRSKNKYHYRIYIKSDSMDKFRSLVNLIFILQWCIN